MEYPSKTLQALQSEDASYIMTLDGESHVLEDVRIYDITTPVRDHAARGNVYTEKSDSYRMEMAVDSSLSSRLSHIMLGPSSQFGGLYISARTKSGNIDIEGGLLSMSHIGGTLRLLVAIVGVG